MKITFNDINKRIKNSSNFHSNSNIKPRLYTESNIFCVNNAINAIENWENLDESSNNAFNKALDIYCELCMNCNKSIIKTYGSYLVENVTKVRDVNQLINSIKYKNSRLRTKIITKINNKLNTVTDNINDKIGNIATAHKQVSNNTIGNNGSSNNISNSMPDNTSNKADNDISNTVEECFNNILSEAIKCKECDRIINNYSKISKRFNIDKIISETAYNNDIYQSICEITSCIDTYAMNFKTKYSCALETVYYALAKNNMNYSKQDIIEAVTDYFIFTSCLNESNIKDISDVKRISVLFDESDFDCVKYLDDNNDDDDVDDTTLNENVYESYGVDFYTLNESDLKKNVDDIIQSEKDKIEEDKKNKKVKQMLDDFRKKCSKEDKASSNIPHLKNLINNIFAKTPYQIVYNLPNIFVIVRTFFVLALTAIINPVVGLIGLITNKIISMTLSRKQTEKVLKAYKNEIDAVKNKLNKVKDEKTKDNLNKYLDELKKDYSKIKDYENNLYSSDENDNRDTSTELYDDDNIDDFDFGFDEAASIIYISNIMQSISEGLLDDNIDGIVYNNIFKLDNDAVDAITDFSITMPIILEKNSLTRALKLNRDTLRESKNKTINDYIRIDCLNDNIHKLETSNMIYDTSNNIKGIACYLTCLDELVKLNASSNYVLELNFTNTLKLAINRLKKTAINLKDKEKNLSTSIDVSANNLSKGIEKAMMNDNRDAVIRGSIIPSASKCIKIALGLGVAWAINPAIAVISAIGGFACSRKLKSKERQLILDDIELELKMCNRYIKEAEDNNDLKKIRELEKIQRNLQRQHQRIKYKMKVVYRQDVPNIKNDDD